MKKLFLYILILSTLSLQAISEKSLTPFEILDKIDNNMVYKKAYSEIEMRIHIKGRTIIKKLISYSKGNNRSFIEFTSPARDKGTKILKIGKIIKIYYPSAERVLRLSGHMLRQSMMGSDFSFEDMTEKSKKLREEYSGKLLTNEIFNGHDCYLMELVSKIDKQTYFRRKIWVDSKKFIALKEELFAKSGKLLKIMLVENIKKYGNRFYPVKVVMEDKLRKDSSTILEIKKIDFKTVIPDSTFSERMLMR